MIGGFTIVMNKPENLQHNTNIGIINRGEAALRFIRAVKEFNNLHATQMRTTAFHTEKEEYSPFVKTADNAVAFSDVPGFAESSGSPYMDHELLLQALKSANCQAVWVGWGFVSEDAEFAELIEKHGFVFLGPSSRAMALLGDKISAKELAEQAN